MKTLFALLIILAISQPIYAIDNETDQIVNIMNFKVDAWKSPPKIRLKKEIKQKYLNYGNISADVLFTTDVKGKMYSVILSRSSGYADIDQIILDGFKQARTKPYLENGVPYPIMATQPISIDF